MKNFKLIRQPKAHWIHLAVASLAAGLAVIWLMASADRACRQAAGDRVFHSAATVPNREICLVLGTRKET